MMQRRGGPTGEFKGYEAAHSAEDSFDWLTLTHAPDWRAGQKGR
jgi:hypothetical protein